MQAGLLSASAVRGGMLVVFALALGVGVYLTTVAGPSIVVIGLASIACAVAYTGGPFPLGYNGLGDVFVMLFFGFVAVCGTAFVQAGHVPALAWWAAAPVGALATAILVVNNVRDQETDTRAGKRTLAVRFGRALRRRRVRRAASRCRTPCPSCSSPRDSSRRWRSCRSSRCRSPSR